MYLRSRVFDIELLENGGTVVRDSHVADIVHLE